MNDKSANFPAIYQNILKHGWNFSFTWLPWICRLIARFSACWIARSPSPLSLSHYWSLFTACIHTICCFTSHSNVFCIFLCRFYAILLRCFTLSPPGVYTSYLPRSLSHTVTHFVQRDGRFCAVCLCTPHFSVFFVIDNCMLCCQKHCPEVDYLNKWAKRRLNNKIIVREERIYLLTNYCCSLEVQRFAPQKSFVLATPLANSQTIDFTIFAWQIDCKIMTQFYCKYTHMQCANIYEENHAILTFTDSATYFVWSTTAPMFAFKPGFFQLTWIAVALQSPTFIPVPSQRHFLPPQSNVLST